MSGTAEIVPALAPQDEAPHVDAAWPGRTASELRRVEEAVIPGDLVTGVRRRLGR